MLLILGILLVIGWAAASKTKWFPYPSSWLKALGLSIPTWWGSIAAFSIAVWLLAYSSIFAVVPDAPLGVFGLLLLLSAVFLVVSLIWHLLLILVYSLLLSLLWSEVPEFLRWMKPPHRKRDILFAWGVSTLASAAVAFPLLLYILVAAGERSRQYREIFTDEVITSMFVGWYITAAYLYHARSLLKSRRKMKSLNQH